MAVSSGLCGRAVSRRRRCALTLLEIAAELAEGEDGEFSEFSEATLSQVLADRTRRFDKGGEPFYDQIY